MNNNQKLNLKQQGKFTFTEAFDKIERKTSNKIEENLNSYIKDANRTLDNIYVANTLFNPLYTLKFLKNKKALKTFSLKRKNKNNKTFNNIKSLNQFTNYESKKRNILPNERNKSLNYLNKFNSCSGTFMNANKKKDLLKLLNKRSNNYRNEKTAKYIFNTFSNFNRNDNLIKNREIIQGNTERNSNRKFNDIINSINDLNRDDNIKEFNSIQTDKQNRGQNRGQKIFNNNEEIKILKALNRNKFNLLKFEKKQLIKEKKKERKIKTIDEDIESIENSLFQNETENQDENYNKNMNNNSSSYNFNNLRKNVPIEFNKHDKNVFNIKTEYNRRNPIVLNTFNKENIINQKISLFKKNANNIKNEKIINDKSNDVNKNKSDNNEETLEKKNKKKEINFNEALNNLSSNRNNSEKNTKKLAKLNYNIYLNCIKNIEKNQNFPDILKYVDKQRLSQYKINDIDNKLKTDGDILLYKNKNLLRNQDKEIKFHKRELMKTTEKENLYNNFKKQIRERYIHTNLTIDAISKISTKLAFFGRQYFMKNYNYDFNGDKDFLFKKEMLTNLGKKVPKKGRYYKVKTSCDKVISNIDHLEKHKNKIMKRLNIYEEKYNDKKRRDFFTIDNDRKNKDKNLIKKRFNLSRNENINFYNIKYK